MAQTRGRRLGGRASGGGRGRQSGFFRPQLEILEGRRLLSSGLEPIFGNGGVVLGLDNNPSSSRVIESHAIRQPDGKIVVTADVQSLTGNMDDGILVERFNADGSLDTTFGQGGMVSLTTPGFRTTILGSSTIESDGKIVVLGRAGFPGYPSEFVLFRLNSDGSLDASLGGSGYMALPINQNVIGYYEFGQAMLLPDGKILEYGSGGLARFNPDGSPDTSFGPGGTGFAAENLGDVTGIAVEANGTIVVTGQTPLRATPFVIVVGEPPPPPPETAGQLYVFSSDGRLENSVVTFGPVPQGSETFSGILIQSDGHIVLSGTHGTQVILARYNPDGTPDTSFGTNGTADFNLGTSAAYPVALAEAPDGDLIAATARPPVPYAGNQSVLIAFAANGSVDSTFGTNGEVETNFNNPQSGSYVNNLIVQPDGSIVVDAIIFLPGTDGAVTGFALASLVNNGTGQGGTPPVTPPPVAPFPVNSPPATNSPTSGLNPAPLPVAGETGGSVSTITPMTPSTAATNAAPALAAANSEKTPAVVAPATPAPTFTAQTPLPTPGATNLVGTTTNLHPLNLIYFGSGGGGAALSIQDAAFVSFGDDL